MNWPMYTVVFIVGVIALIIGVDIVWAVNKRDGDTISEVLRSAGWRWMPLIILFCFGFGLLCGHWWWSSGQCS